MNNYQYKKPGIYVYYSSEIRDISIFNDVLFGIEEEGIPYEIKEKEQLNPLELSYMAAQDSRLAVGIGIHIGGEITLTSNKLKKEKPLFSANLGCEKDSLRNLGANAGRLVKGIAFK